MTIFVLTLVAVTYNRLFFAAFGLSKTALFCSFVLFLLLPKGQVDNKLELSPTNGGLSFFRAAYFGFLVVVFFHVLIGIDCLNDNRFFYYYALYVNYYYAMVNDLVFSFFFCFADRHLPIDKIGDTTAVEGVLTYFGNSAPIGLRQSLVAIRFLTIFGKRRSTNPSMISLYNMLRTKYPIFFEGISWQGAVGCMIENKCSLPVLWRNVGITRSFVGIVVHFINLILGFAAGLLRLPSTAVIDNRVLKLFNQLNLLERAKANVQQINAQKLLSEVRGADSKVEKKGVTSPKK